jgi:pimeloyl-ACP methyl ester carboxylesterase
MFLLLRNAFGWRAATGMNRIYTRRAKCKRPGRMKNTHPPYGRLTLEPHRFEAGRGGPVDAEWGTLTVPENRRRQGSHPITLSFVRLPATTRDPGHPVVFLAGGPGESGIRFARGRHFAMFAALREVGDVIALDQRGTGASRPPLRCDTAPPQPAPGRPAVRDQVLAETMARSRACAGTLRQSGIDLAGYHTVENADDLDDLRAALGAEKIHLWGLSYGTHLAFAFLKRHSSRAGRCVLGGAEGPDHTLKLPSVVQRQLERIGALCAAHPAWRGRLPDFVSSVAEVLERLERAPVAIGLPDPAGGGKKVTLGLGRFDVEYATAVGLADIRLLSLLPAWYDGMSRGDYTLPSREPLLARYLFLSKRGLGGNAMGLLMDCASGATKARWERIEREAREAVLGRTIDFPLPEIGEAWGNPDLGDDYRSPVRADNPVLFFSGSLDCRTPLDNVMEVCEGLPNARPLVVDGAGHTDVFLSCPGAAETVCRFLRGEEVDTAPRSASRPFSLAEPVR